MSNFRANTARTREDLRAEGQFVQGELDILETPRAVTQALLDAVPFEGPIREPAAGSGRIVRVLEDNLFDVAASDIRDGWDYLATPERWAGDVVTNPPYSGGRAEAFVRKALTEADGRVAMLLRLGFLCSDRRASGLWAEHPLETVLVIPYRIYFYKVSGEAIAGQAYDHAWFVWPDRARRGRGGAGAELRIASDLRTRDERRRRSTTRGAHNDQT